MKSINQSIKNVIFVASGKGGVGKTTVAVNLAIALAREGYKTGLMDADLYGPSIPLAMGITGNSLEVLQDGEQEVFYPPEKFGVKVMSLGFLMKKESAVIWRGPMASKALTQLLEGTQWGEIDFLLVDLPPGTGDIAITLSQKLPEAKAIIVITPQQMAIDDGRKAAGLFNSNILNIPILGIVENMSYFTPETHPEEKYLLFGEGGGNQLAKELKVPLLSQIPLIADVCTLEDAGKSIFAHRNKILIQSFEDLAEKVYTEKGMNLKNDNSKHPVEM